MTSIKITGTETVDALADRVAGVDAKLLARTTNKVMDKERTQVRRALVQETGAAYGRVVRTTRSQPASPGGLSYTINAQDEPTSLADYGARETRKGVSAAPWRTRRVFGGTFMKGGAFRARAYLLSLGGHVYIRAGKDRFPIVKLWGPSLPREMVREDGEPIEAWRKGVSRLQDRILIEASRQISGPRR